MDVQIVIQVIFPNVDGIIDCDRESFNKAVLVGLDIDGEHRLAKLRIGEETAVVNVWIRLACAMVEHENVDVLIQHVHYTTDGEWFLKGKIQDSRIF